VNPVSVRDLGTGEQSSRPNDTLTLDVPHDFPRASGVFTVADGFRASYTTADGRQVNCSVTARPLRWRIKGEMCLIARTGGVRRMRQYRLCSVSPDDEATAR
jgi:hypothetical protein